MYCSNNRRTLEIPGPRIYCVLQCRLPRASTPRERDMRAQLQHCQTTYSYPLEKLTEDTCLFCTCSSPLPFSQLIIIPVDVNLSFHDRRQQPQIGQTLAPDSRHREMRYSFPNFLPSPLPHLPIVHVPLSLHSTACSRASCSIRSLSRCFILPSSELHHSFCSVDSTEAHSP